MPGEARRHLRQAPSWRGTGRQHGDILDLLVKELAAIVEAALILQHAFQATIMLPRSSRR